MIEFPCYHYVGVASNHTRETQTTLEKHEPRVSYAKSVINVLINTRLYVFLVLTHISTRTRFRSHTVLRALACISTRTRNVILVLARILLTLAHMILLTPAISLALVHMH